MGQGEPGFVPIGWAGRAEDSADLTALAFLQCYAREPLQWEIMCFFSMHQDEWATLRDVAEELPYTVSELLAGLGDLAETKLLEQQVRVYGPVFRLTGVPELRRMAVRFGWEWRECSLCID